MLSDIEIAQSAKMLPITEIAEKLDILPEELELYGRYKAKLSEDIFARLQDKPDGKLVLVTAINPTPPEKERPLHQSAWGRQWHESVKKRSSLCGNRRWAQFSASKAALPEADIPR